MKLVYYSLRENIIAIYAKKNSNCTVFNTSHKLYHQVEPYCSQSNHFFCQPTANKEFITRRISSEMIISSQNCIEYDFIVLIGQVLLGEKSLLFTRRMPNSFYVRHFKPVTSFIFHQIIVKFWAEKELQLYISNASCQFFAKVIYILFF